MTRRSRRGRRPPTNPRCRRPPPSRRFPARDSPPSRNRRRVKLRSSHAHTSGWSQTTDAASGRRQTASHRWRRAPNHRPHRQAAPSRSGASGRRQTANPPRRPATSRPTGKLVSSGPARPNRPQRLRRQPEPSQPRVRRPRPPKHRPSPRRPPAKPGGKPGCLRQGPQARARQIEQRQPLHGPTPGPGPHRSGLPR